jgi:hypothetical protein
MIRCTKAPTKAGVFYCEKEILDLQEKDESRESASHGIGEMSII